MITTLSFNSFLYSVRLTLCYYCTIIVTLSTKIEAILLAVDAAVVVGGGGGDEGGNVVVVGGVVVVAVFVVDVFNEVVVLLFS